MTNIAIVVWALIFTSSGGVALIFFLRALLERKNELYGSGIIFFIICFILSFLYFLPTLVASERKHRNEVAIFVLNMLLGVTVLGWVGSLVWALLEDEKKN